MDEILVFFIIMLAFMLGANAQANNSKENSKKKKVIEEEPEKPKRDPKGHWIEFWLVMLFLLIVSVGFPLLLGILSS